jgi:hypothetical protein
MNRCGRSDKDIFSVAGHLGMKILGARMRLAIAALAMMTPACATDAPPPAAEQRLVMPGVLDLPLAPAHSIDPVCGLGDPGIACVVTSHDAPRTDRSVHLSRYVEALAAKGWTQIGPDLPGMAVMRRGGRAPRCVQLASLLYDDGKAARIIWKEIVRFDLDPEGVDCAAGRLLTAPSDVDLRLAPPGGKP